MTREEAIVYFERILAGAKQGLERHPEEGKRVYGMRKELSEIALSALRPVSRERVEKVWRGDWKFEPDIYDCETYVCSKCGEPWTLIDGTPVENNMNFCPNCGAAITDEAVQIVMERMEKLYEQTSN